MLARLSAEDTILQRLSPDLEDMAPALGQLIQEQDTVVRQRHLPRHGQLAAADQTHLGDGVVGGPEGARGDEGGASTGQASDARDAGGLPRVRPARRRQEEGEAMCQHWLSCPGWAEQQPHSVHYARTGFQLTSTPRMGGS
jgi:hypothetical protein